VPYTLTVNGRFQTGDGYAGEPLLWVLRDVLNLRGSGTTIGCGKA
jgi:aerobic-type carbon monoxide dehydrogenase small subunit (CoxS/CutS family)